jgi:hypothetical protein
MRMRKLEPQWLNAWGIVPSSTFGGGWQDAERRKP